MKSIILSLLAVVAISAFSCTNYGKKVTIDGTKGEVYYKGEGVTEEQAKKLGEYLKDGGYFIADKKLSVQLTKSTGDGFDIRFAMDEKKVNEHPEMTDQFVKFGAALSIDQFNNKPVNIFFADARFKDFKSLPFDKEMVKKIMEPGDPNEGTANPTDSTGNANPADSTDHTNQEGHTTFFSEAAGRYPAVFFFRLPVKTYFAT
jgi:hypothetical protein